MNEAIPQFPNYPPPNPQGVEIVDDPRFHKPLVKLMKQMLHPKQHKNPIKLKRSTKRKKLKFY